jgi:hypothetical protein
MKTKTKMKQKIKTEKTKQKKESRKTGWTPTKTNEKKVTKRPSAWNIYGPARLENS